MQTCLALLCLQVSWRYLLYYAQTVHTPIEYSLSEFLISQSGYLISMCFDLWCCTGFLASAIAPWLSTCKHTHSTLQPCMSANSCLRNLASCVAAANAMYSASHVDKATVCCLRLFHEIKGPLLHNWKPYPVMLRLSSDAPQSESQN